MIKWTTDEKGRGKMSLGHISSGQSVVTADVCLCYVFAKLNL